MLQTKYRYKLRKSTENQQCVYFCFSPTPKSANEMAVHYIRSNRNALHIKCYIKSSVKTVDCGIYLSNVCSPVRSIHSRRAVCVPIFSFIRIRRISQIIFQRFNVLFSVLLLSFAEISDRRLWKRATRKFVCAFTRFTLGAYR